MLINSGGNERWTKLWCDDGSVVGVVGGQLIASAKREIKFAAKEFPESHKILL